jgi:AraC-like DNA-binding protein
LRVSEAAYRTGFSDPNYFSICFKKEFGENPSQIVSSIKDLGDQTDIETLPNDAKPDILFIH